MSESEVWRRAMSEANADIQRIHDELRETKLELKATRKRLNLRREVLKAELRDAERAKKSAAYALKTGKEPG